MSLLLAKKQEELNKKKVRELLSLQENRKCFDCPTKGPAYVNTSIQTLVCARCSGLVREVGHRVKSISASKFSGPELLALTMGGNATARKIWLSNYSTPNAPEPETDDDVRAFMRQKYYENKWLDWNLLKSHTETVRSLIAKSFDQDGLPITAKSRENKMMAPGTFRIQTNEMQKEEYVQGYQMNNIPTPSTSHPMNNFSITSPITPTSSMSYEKSRVSIDSQRSGTSTSSINDRVYSNRNSHESARSGYASENSKRQSMDSTCFSTGSISSVNNDDNEYIRESSVTSFQQYPINQQHYGSYSKELPYSSNGLKPQTKNNIPGQIIMEKNSSASSIVTQPNISKPRPLSTTSDSFNNILSELADLKIEKTVKRATYTGGILSPTSVPLSPNNNTEGKERPKSMFDSDFFTKLEEAKKTKLDIENDPYAALRGIHTSLNISSNAAINDDKNASSSEDEDEDQWQEFCSSSTFDENDNFEQTPQPEIENTTTKAAEPIVSVDLFSDLDPLSMYKR